VLAKTAGRMEASGHELSRDVVSSNMAHLYVSRSIPETSSPFFAITLILLRGIILRQGRVALGSSASPPGRPKILTVPKEKPIVIQS